MSVMQKGRGIMFGKKLSAIIIYTILFIFSIISAAFAEGTSPPSFNGTVFGLLFVFVLGLGIIVLYGVSKVSAVEAKTAKSHKESKKSHKK